MNAPSSIAELTPRAILLGLVLSVVMAAANVYLGLKAGMTVSASIPAAVVAMLILRGVFKGGTILEANQVQTAASAGESLAAGIIFTMPALLLIGVWKEFDLVTTTLIAFTGGLLGILFMIPMRRVFVVDNKELAYPEGVACAAVLQAGEKGGANVVWGGAVGALFKLLVSFFGLLHGTLEVATRTAGGRVWFLGADISPALIAVGFIVRLNVALLLFLGGALGWLVCIPFISELDAILGSISPSLSHPIVAEGAAVEQAWTLWSKGVRYVGVGAMVVGGIASIIRVRAGLMRAVEELRKRFRAEQSTEDDGQDLSPRTILIWSVIAVVSIAAIYYHFTGGIGITLLTTTVMVVMSFFFVAVASYIVGLVGNSNSPVSGMTITAVLFTGGLLYIAGFSGTDGMVATLGVAAIVCCAACTSGDVCNDLKTGSLVGATPRKQQIIQIAGVAVASLVMAPVLQLLHNAYGIGSRELSAPQAGLFASLAQGFFGEGELPWGLVGVGALLGALVLLVDGALERRGSAFRMHLMPVAVGMYLPFGLSIPILLGGLLAHLHAGGESDAHALDRKLHRGILFSSGVIAGESLIGVVIAILVSMNVSGPKLSVANGELVTLAFAVALLWLFHARTRESAE
jgi:putative OPT family oligopeptide transporter